ncbi:MAG: heavy-metal-associated domain-containing protein [Ignavibacteria bacterium]|nr:heavy-metal-associated domain-containing protein [Ignavibacteria bacterium]
MTRKEIRIEGMTCDHCVMAVNKELAKVPDLHIINVRIGSTYLEFDESKVNMSHINAAVEEAGYKITI